jgi:hypothetical protein
MQAACSPTRPGSPPRSKYIKTIGDFLMLGYLKVGATEYPSKWTTSGLNDATTCGRSA